MVCLRNYCLFVHCQESSRPRAQCQNETITKKKTQKRLNEVSERAPG